MLKITLMIYLALRRVFFMFVEVFELAEPGKEFEVYTENLLRRKK